MYLKMFKSGIFKEDFRRQFQVTFSGTFSEILGYAILDVIETAKFLRWKSKQNSYLGFYNFKLFYIKYSRWVWKTVRY